MATVSLVASEYVQTTVNGTTSAINTTGADLLVAVVCAYFIDNAWVPTDSASNTWTALTEYGTNESANIRAFYVANPTTNASHTLTVNHSAYGSNYMTAVFLAFSGITTTSPADQQNGGVSSSSESKQTGSVTPTENDELLLATFVYDGGAITGLSIDNSLTIAEHGAYAAGTALGGAVAWIQQSTAAAINPAWSWTTARTNAAAIYTFKNESPGAGGGGSSVTYAIPAIGPGGLVGPRRHLIG